MRDLLTKNGFWVALAGEPLPRTLESLLGLDKVKRKEEVQQKEPTESSVEAAETDGSVPLLFSRAAIEAHTRSVIKLLPAADR